MRLKLSLFALIVFACLTPSISLQAQNQAPLSISDAVSRSVKYNPRLSAASREVLAARLGLRSARSLANPEIAFTPGFSAGGSDTELLIRQPLELNGTRAARTGVANAQLRRAGAQAIVELRNLVFDTKAAYVALFRAREQLGLATEALRSSQEFDRIAHLLVDAGSRPGIEVTQTGIEVARSKQLVVLAESDETNSVTALNTLMGRKPDEPIGPVSLPPATSLDVTNETLISQALAARAEITADEAAAEALRQEAKLARAEGRPDLAPQFRATTVTRGFNDSGVGIGITLPLFDYGSRRNRVRQAEQAAQAQTDRTAVTRNQVRQEVEQAITRLRAARTVAVSYQQGVLEQSRRLLEASRIGFQEGKTSIVTVLEAQRTYRAVQTEYANAQAEYAAAQAELERARGSVPSTLLPEVRR